MCIASPDANKSLLNLPIKNHGKVIYYSAEDAEQFLWSRVGQIAGHLSLEGRKQCIDNVILYDSTCATDMLLENDNIINSIINDVHQHDNVRLVILDSLSSLTATDKNAEIVRQMEKITTMDVAVLFIDTRGASVLMDNSRYNATLSKMSKDEAVKYNISNNDKWKYIKLTVPKANYCPPLDDTWFKNIDGVLLPVELVNLTDEIRYIGNYKHGIYSSIVG
jgi:RecA-family ATPase